MLLQFYMQTIMWDGYVLYNPCGLLVNPRVFNEQASWYVKRKSYKTFISSFIVSSYSCMFLQLALCPADKFPAAAALHM